jgi:cell wall assembly regulator SMI1
VQKFTRPITREIELAGERLALTLSEEDVSVRPVGSRSTPRTMSWASFFCCLSGEQKEPSTQEVGAAVAALKKPPSGKKAAKSNPPAEAAKETAPEQAPAAGGLRALLDRLEKWLAKHRPHFLKGLRPGANAAELHQLGAQLSLSVPEDLQTLLAWHNGQTAEFTGRFEENWRLLGTEEMVAAKQDLDAGAAGNGQGNGWKPGWIPFLDNDSGDYLVLDTTQAGAPVRGFWLGQAEQPVEAPSLTKWVEAFVTAVEAGQYHEDPEHGTFLRKTS